MSIHCQCSACGAKFKTGPERAGQKVKCPKCAGVIVIPRPGDSQKLAMAKPLDEGPPSGIDPPVETGPPVMAVPPVRTGPPDQSPVESATVAPAKAAATEPAPAEASGPQGPDASPAEEPGAGFPHIVTAEPSMHAGASHASGVGLHPPKKVDRTQRLALMISAGALAVVLLAVGAYALFAPSKDSGRNANRGRPGRETVEDPSAEPTSVAEGRSALVLDWHEADRADATVSIDEQARPLPSSGAVQYELEPGIHAIALSRPGYDDVEVRMALEAGGSHRFAPQWRESASETAGPPASSGGEEGGEVGPEGPDVAVQPPTEPEVGPTEPETPKEPELVRNFDDWLQDYEAAREQAATEKKDVLVFFDGSDWCGYCRKLSTEVLWKPEFRQKVAEKYVPVHLDFPRNPEAQAKVENSIRNARLKTRFGVSGFPTVLLTDAQGQPFGTVGGYVPGGVDAYLARLEGCQRFRKQLDQLFAEMEAADNFEDRQELVATAVMVLQEHGLWAFYQSQVRNWLAGRPRTAPTAEPEKPEPEEPEVKLAEADLEDPEKALEKLELTPRGETLCLPGDVELDTTMRGAEKMRVEAFEAGRKIDTIEKVQEQKRQMIMGYLQKRRELRAQLARTSSIDAQVRITTAMNELADRIVMLQQSLEQDQEAQKARAEANAVMENYVEFILGARELHDKTAARYKELEEDPLVKQVIAKHNEATSREDELGPSRYFQSAARKLASLERNVLSEEIDIRRRGGADLWYVSVMINGQSAHEMAIDTGASVIALPWETAKVAGLTPGSDDPVIPLQMADGRVIEGRLVVAEKVRVGKFTVENVECAVLPENAVAAEPLLGQSFLKHFTVKIEAGTHKLVLSQVGGEKK